MTDNEIKKALECLLDKMGAYECEQVSIGKGLIMDTLDLINRQKAEIERLEIKVKTLKEVIKYYERQTELAKSEAVKDFADRLKDRICDNLNDSLDNPNGNNYFITDVYTDIDNIVKEKVGE